MATAKKTVKKEKVASSASLEAKVYSAAGKEVSSFTLPESIFGVKRNTDLVHQVVAAMRANARHSTAHTKNRGEVRGGGRKPWKQKGTGRARHGSSRSPIWKGGGVTHGPRNDKNYSQAINKKMRVGALYAVLSEKFRAGEILFVEKLDLKDSKTASGAKVISALAKVSGFERLAGKKKTALVALPGKDESNRRALRNLASIELTSIKDINPVDVLDSRYLIVTAPEESVKTLVGRSAK
jgi:large subunit ribosomal protein L4